MLSDIDICRTTSLSAISDIAKQAGLLDHEYHPQGFHKAKVTLDAVSRLKDNRDGKLIVVTAITPTPLGEGKTVTTIGLSQGLKKLNKSVMACIRQPSMGLFLVLKAAQQAAAILKLHQWKS